MKPETAAWMNSLPKPDDKEGWRKRQSEILQGVFDDSFLELITLPEPNEAKDEDSE